MKKIVDTALFMMLIAATASNAQRRDEMPEMGRRNIIGGELFTYRVYNLPDTTDQSKSAAVFHFSIVNDMLTFVKNEDDSYRARYEIIVVFYNEKKEAIVEKSIRNTIAVDRYEETNSRLNPCRHILSVTLPPAEYDYTVELLDSESKNSLVRERKIHLLDFRGEQVQISDVIFVDRYDSLKNSLIPNLNNTFSDINSEFSAYFEVVPDHDTVKLTIITSIYNSDGKRIKRFEREYNTSKTISQYISFREDLKKPGEYILSIEVRSGEISVKKRSKFNVNWSNLKLQSDNLDVAIEQLRIIAKKRDVDRIKNADSDEKKKLYDEFWSDRDPTANTVRNEYKELFFTRIDYANRSFTEIYSGRPGWETDRGHVYIKNGPPDQIERQPTEIGVPTAEIWFYSKLNQRYIFSDRRGTGEYRLVKVE